MANQDATVTQTACAVCCLKGGLVLRCCCNPRKAAPAYRYAALDVRQLLLPCPAAESELYFAKLRSVNDAAARSSTQTVMLAHTSTKGSSLMQSM